MVWRRHAFLAGGGIVGLLILFGPGLYECISTATCIRDPCLHCVAAALTPNVQAALLTVTFGGLIAWWYQRANKIMEFRFETFKDMSANFTECCHQAILVRIPHKYIEDMVLLAGGRPGAMAQTDQQAKTMESERQRLAVMANEGFAIWQRLHPPIFGEAVSDPWLKMNALFRDYAKDPIQVTEFNRKYQEAMERGSAALHAARAEMGMPYRSTKLMRAIERKQAAKQPAEG